LRQARNRFQRAVAQEVKRLDQVLWPPVAGDSMGIPFWLDLSSLELNECTIAEHPPHSNSLTYIDDFEPG
jgi:hypothetical protein